MTRDEMLEKMDLTEDELQGLLASFRDCYAKLNDRQQAAITRSLPSMTEALQAFGPDVTQESLQQLFGDEMGVAIGGFYFLARSSGSEEATAS